MTEDAMKNPAPFEYCAIRYLEQYVTTDKALLASFGNGPTADDVLTLLSKYGVSRSFGKISIEENARFICSELTREAQFERGPAMRRLSHLPPRYRKNSTRTPFQRHQNCCGPPIQIASSFTTPGPMLRLQGRPQHLKPRNYIAYVAEWNKGYQAAKAEIALAVKALKKLPREFTAAHAMPKDQFATTLGSEAFRRRVYDQFLWLNGSLLVE
jgi:hypothetical protein